MAHTIRFSLERALEFEPDAEIILVNDGSTDDTLEIMREYARKNKRITIVNLKKNSGLLVARREGYKVSKGDYIAYMDADDLISKRYYSQMIPLCPDGGMCIGRGRRWFMDMPFPVRTSNSSPLRWFIYETDNLDKRVITYIWSKVFHRDLARKIFENWDVPWMVHLEDTVVMAKAFRYSTDIAFCDEGTYIQLTPSRVNVPDQLEARLKLYPLARKLLEEFLEPEDVDAILEDRVSNDYHTEEMKIRAGSTSK